MTAEQDKVDELEAWYLGATALVRSSPISQSSRVGAEHVLTKIHEMQDKYPGITIYAESWSEEDDTDPQIVEDFRLAWDPFL